MAINKQGNIIYADQTGELTGSNVKVSYIVFYANGAADVATLSSATSTSVMLEVANSAAGGVTFLDFSRRPLVFPNGINLRSLSSNASVTIAITQGGE